MLVNSSQLSFFNFTIHTFLLFISNFSSTIYHENHHMVFSVVLSICHILCFWSLGPNCNEVLTTNQLNEPLIRPVYPISWFVRILCVRTWFIMSHRTTLRSLIMVGIAIVPSLLRHSFPTRTTYFVMKVVWIKSVLHWCVTKGTMLGRATVLDILQILTLAPGPGKRTTVGPQFLESLLLVVDAGVAVWFFWARGVVWESVSP